MQKPCLPQRIFYSLAEVIELWGMSHEEVWQWLMHGELFASVWLPLMSVYEIVEEEIGDYRMTSRRLKHFEGYAALSPCHCRSLFRHGNTALREFSDAIRKERYLVPEAAESFDVRTPELVVLQEECHRFEQSYGQRTAEPRADASKPDSLQQASNDLFKFVRFEEKELRFGDIQSAILRQLYQSAFAGSPWQNGKKLLAAAGSQCFTLSNVFKRHPAWKRRLIISDGRGSYRLDDAFLTALHHGIGKHVQVQMTQEYRPQNLGSAG